MTSNKRLKAKAVKHHKRNLYHLETGKEFRFGSRQVRVKKRNNQWVVISIHGSACVFCRKYVDTLRFYMRCINCPICRVTGRAGCVNTPWVDIRWAFNAENVQDAIEAEKAEIAFLESLEV